MINNQLVRQVADNRPSKQQRVVGRAVVERVQLSGHQADGAIALAGHMMRELTDLDRERRTLAQDDVTLNIVLSEIEATAIAQCKQIQRNLYSPWGL